MKHPNEAHKESLSQAEKIGLVITGMVGTLICAIVFTILAAVSLPSVIKAHSAIIWIQWITQTFLQLVLLPIILVGQNVQSKHSEHVAEATYQLAQKIDSIVEKDIAH